MLPNDLSAVDNSYFHAKERVTGSSPVSSNTVAQLVEQLNSCYRLLPHSLKGKIMRQNVALPSKFNHEGIKIPKINDIQLLRRSVLSCLLWEKEFYEDGESIVTRILDLVKKIPAQDVSRLAIEARNEYKMRHVSLLLASALAKNHNGRIVGDTISCVIQRADELTEFIAIHAKVNDVTPDKVKPTLSKQCRTGIARAFHKFDAYHLQKYNRDGAVKLRDALFLSHPKPKNDEQAALWKALAEGKLPTPDTWETNLSAGADKKETFTRLIQENKLGYMALLKNLRNMVDSGIEKKLIEDALIAGAPNSKALPFRFIAAARHAPSLEPTLDLAMQLSLKDAQKLDGRTIILVDISPSMSASLSSKSDLTRIDAACGLAILLRGVCSDVRVFAFANAVAEVPARNGMALADAIIRATESNGTYLGKAVKAMNLVGYDRLIVVTDEESQDAVPAPTGELAYMINVASTKNGIGYGNGWTCHIDGFSEAVVNYIAESEKVRD